MESGGIPVLHPVFTVGQRFVYDAWDINRYGQRIDSSYRTHTRVVRSLHGFIGGITNAIVLSDSVVVQRTGQVFIDSIYYRITADSGLAQFGFLAALERKRKEIDTPAQWDRLYSPGVMSWVVGATDSAGENRVTASFQTEVEYFEVLSNTMSMILPAYRVEMYGVSLDCALWLSDIPTCLPRFEELPDPYSGIFSGTILILKEAGL